ncbi:MAG: DUF3500 domain-containing protein [Pseudohongiellaceae bacterium]
MSKQNSIKRILKYSLAMVVALALFTFALLQNPRFLTQIFFGTAANAVELALQDSYSPRETDEKTTAIAVATNLFLNSLSEQQRQTAMYGFDDNTQRANWSNLPEGMVPRGGLKLGELSEEQRGLMDGLLGEFMSDKGVQNTNYQLAAENTLSPNRRLKFGTQHYYVAFLGEPSASEPWMFQFGGHHIAINITIYGADLTFSPMLTGGQPLHISYDGEDIFITEEETMAAQAFLDSLTADQKRIAVRGTEAIDLLLGPGKYGTVIAPEGIKGSDLTEAQKQMLISVISARLDFINADDNAAAMATVVAELDDTYFGWWGEQGTLGAAYFRITAPSMVLEYSPQGRNVASATDHAHSMYRDPQNDYGSAWIDTAQ